MTIEPKMFLDLAEMDCSTINLAQAFLPNRVEIFLIFFVTKRTAVVAQLTEHAFPIPEDTGLSPII